MSVNEDFPVMLPKWYAQSFGIDMIRQPLQRIVIKFILVIEWKSGYNIINIVSNITTNHLSFSEVIT